MANIRDVAKHAGVSITTVSRVLNNGPGVSAAARQAVMTAVNEAGYVPEVGRRCTSNIALLYTDVPTLDSPFDAALLVGMYEGLPTIGCDLIDRAPGIAPGTESVTGNTRHFSGGNQQ